MILFEHEHVEEFFLLRISNMETIIQRATKNTGVWIDMASKLTSVIACTFC